MGATTTSTARPSSILDMLLLVLSLTSLAAAQTWTNCNPLNGTCPSDPALSTNATWNFTQNGFDTKIWNTTAGPIGANSQGATFAIQDETMSPTVQSMFYIFFGRVETIMQAAPGQGIVSSVVLQSDDLDEIDWEFVGSNASSVQSNFYGKGDHSTYDRVAYHSLDKNPFENFINYTTVWTAEKLEWWIDGQLQRTLNYGDALAHGGARYPQTPCTVRLGSWPAGRKGNNNGTIEWAGGLADFSGDKSYTMTVQSLYVEDFSSGKEYTYGDRSGNWQSIKSVAGNSTAAKEIWSPHGVRANFNALPKGAQIGIVAGVIGLVAVLFLLLVFCCIKQRRAGRAEKKLADAEYEKGAAELMDYRRMMAAGKFGHGGGMGSPSVSHQQPPPLSKSPTVTVMDQGRPVKSGWL